MVTRLQNNEKIDNVAGLLWFLRLWIILYFPEFIPLSQKNFAPSSSALVSLGRILQTTPIIQHSAFNFATELFTATRHSKEFFPVADKPHNLLWMSTNVSSSQDPQMANYISLCWGSVLSKRDLMCGLKPSSRYNKISTEFYCPHLLAR